MTVQRAETSGGGIMERRALLFTPVPGSGGCSGTGVSSLPPTPSCLPTGRRSRPPRAQIAAAERTYRKVFRWCGVPSLVAVVLLLLLAGCAKAINGPRA